MSRAPRVEPGRHTAKFFTSRPTSVSEAPSDPDPAAAWRTPWQTPSAETVREIFEQRPELPYLQREQWRAAAFAELGVDYDHPTTNITPVRRVTA
nr:hypothetical protein [Streptomyces typhae]